MTRVVLAAEVGEDGTCPACGGLYDDCPCPGPTQDGWTVYEQRGALYATPEETMTRKKTNPPRICLNIDLKPAERAALDEAAALVTDERGRPMRVSTWARRVLLAAARGER
jgi:hypothetical protein